VTVAKVSLTKFSDAYQVLDYEHVMQLRFSESAGDDRRLRKSTEMTIDRLVLLAKELCEYHMILSDKSFGRRKQVKGEIPWECSRPGQRLQSADDNCTATLGKKEWYVEYLGFDYHYF